MALDNGGNVQATVTASEILDYATATNGASLTDISDELDIAKSTAYRHVNTLVDLGFLTKDDQEYYPGFKLFRYGSAARRNRPLLEVAPDELDRVYAIASERVGLYVVRDDRLYEVYWRGESGGPSPVDGATEPLVRSAPGRCLIAHSDWESVVSLAGVDELVDDLEALHEALVRIRREGVAIDRNRDRRLARVAVPIRVNDSTIAAVGVAGPRRRLSGERVTDDLPGLLQNAARTIELQILSACPRGDRRVVETTRG